MLDTVNIFIRLTSGMIDVKIEVVLDNIPVVVEKISDVLDRILAVEEWMSDRKESAGFFSPIFVPFLAIKKILKSLTYLLR